MGASLARAAQWTNVAESGKGKLELSPMNEMLLNDIIQFVESFGKKYPVESKYVFKDALSWKSMLTEASFSVGYDVSGTKVASQEKDESGNPLMQFIDGKIEVRSFDQAADVLQAAKEKRLNETRLCLEANRDPIVKILGPGFATTDSEDSTVIRLVEKSKSEENEESSIQLRILLTLQQFDMKLLNSSMQEISKQVRLSPAAVNAEVELLQSFAGIESTTPLKDIRFTSQHVFSNKCRALPWRQVHGDICYVLVEPHDGSIFCVTAATYGCFVNGGFDNKTQEVDYEKKGEVYKDLVSLLRDKSSKFAENIAKKLQAEMVVVDTARLFPVDESIVQQKCYTTKPRLDWGTWERIEAISASLKELVSITTQVEFAMQEEYLRDSERETAPISETIQDTEPKVDVVADKEAKNVKETGKKEGKAAKDRKKMQPSLKWKHLEDSRKSEKAPKEQKKLAGSPPTGRRPSYFM